MSDKNNKNKLYAVTGLSFFWGPDVKDDSVAVRSAVRNAAAKALSEDIYNIEIENCVFEITSKSDKENILAASHRLVEKTVAIGSYVPYSSEKATTGMIDGTVFDYIEAMKQQKSVDSSSDSYDGKVVEIDGKQYKLTEVCRGKVI